jgi:hypothetical protein
MESTGTKLNRLTNGWKEQLKKDSYSSMRAIDMALRLQDAIISDEIGRGDLLL